MDESTIENHDPGLLRAGDCSRFEHNRAMVAAVCEGETGSAVARRYGVSRQWLHRLLARFGEQDEAGLAPRSRRPSRTDNATGARVRRRVIEVRATLEVAGFDCGARSVRDRLLEEEGCSPSRATIHRMLRDTGGGEAEPRKRPRSSWMRFEARLPNETWQSDFTHWRVAGGRDLLIVTWMDDHSHMVPGSWVSASVTAALVRDTFLSCCERHGVPVSTLTDNGSVYTSRLVSADGWREHEFESTLRRLGVEQKNGKPYQPQTQGKIERWHRTLKQWLAKQPLAADERGLQAQLDEFVEYCNTKRPTVRSTDAPPARAYRERDKAPAPTPPRRQRRRSPRPAQP